MKMMDMSNVWVNFSSSAMTVKLLRHETTDPIVAPNLWLPNIPDYSSGLYRILAVQQEWIYRTALRDVD